MTLHDLASQGVHISHKAELGQLLECLYPHLDWHKFHLLQGRFAQQRHLERVVAALFEGEEIKVNARKETQIQSDVTGEWLELDIWLPRLNLAFEFQVLFSLLSSFFTPSFFLLITGTTSLPKQWLHRSTCEYI
jgi:hypothetical protein